MSGPGLLLIAAILVPWLTAILLILGKSWPDRMVQGIGLLGFTVPAVIALVLWAWFGQAPVGPDGYRFVIEMPTGLDQVFGVSLKLGLNGLALPLYIAAGWIGLAAGLYTLRGGVDRQRYYFVLLLFMHGGLMGIFAAVDLFFFYFFHEVALIPTFILMVAWGGRGRRSAAMMMVVCLTAGAMLSLAGLIALYVQSGATAFDIVSIRQALAAEPLAATNQKVLFGLLLLGFGILVSLWPFHHWAPPTYATAPTAAAMLHAGVLKNFGLYGLAQIAIPCLPAGALAWREPLLVLALGNVLVIGLVTLAQHHLKHMVAYSSVMHVGYGFLGLGCLSAVGLGGSVILMVGYGLTAALLLLLATAIFQRSETFDMDAMGGLAHRAPFLVVCAVAALFASIGLPGFANFWGELAVFIGLWEYSPGLAALAMIGVVLSAVYALRAAARMFFGPDELAVPDRAGGHDLRFSEALPVVVLLAALLFIGLYPRGVTAPLQEAIAVADSPWEVELGSPASTPAVVRGSGDCQGTRAFID